MKLKQLTLKQSLNKAFRLIKPERGDIEQFKANFKLLLGHINPHESEENLKGHVMDFLKNTYYTPDYHIATKGRTDFVIHTGKDASHHAGVLFEAKKPSNNEMVTITDLNRKAMHEIILYYLRERIEHKNDDIRHIVITNIYEWFVFDAPQFERLFYKNVFLIKEYKTWLAKQKVSANNDHFYNEIAKPFLASLTEEIEFTYFDIRDFEKPLFDADKDNDNKLIPLFKALSPTHLLKLPFANDSNSLDRGFYTELLYLIGLEEVKEGNKKVIRRKLAGKRNDGSLIENTIVQLDTENCIHKLKDPLTYGDTKDEQIFSVALELCITWVNRILFLKLLEAQLLKYHRGNTAYKFLNYNIIHQYDELYKLFFLVLAKPFGERTEKVKHKYSHIPYLNSSLFDITPLEEQTIRINMLDDEAEMLVHDRTVLKDDKGKLLAPKLNTLKYIFEFLNAYDFASEGTEEIQEERKTLINASVLGLIFEKINGYKDGSIFTPGFITMYMCRQSLRQVILNKFKEKYNWKAETFEDLHNYISDDRSAKAILEFNKVINSLTMCDPAVGSGHFLVSLLNELIAIKSELGILADAKGKRLTEHTATVENDELLITDKERNFFSYYVATNHEQITIPNAEIQRVQETLFHEKQILIENCLFGVDINQKSVQICRLRLWIELLKNAYYLAEGNKSNGELQTLPNIDINIKSGNSLISRFDLDEDLKSATPYFEKKILEYKSWVKDYKHEVDKDKKRGIQQLMLDLKKGFLSKVTDRNPTKKKLDKLTGEFLSKYVSEKLFSQNLTEAQKKDKERLDTEIEKLNKELEAYLKSPVYNNAFEWRFEFPEVLDDEGNFKGFDLVIGNPPYGATITDEIKEIFRNKYKDYHSRWSDTFNYFIARTLEISNDSSHINLIIPNNFLFQNEYEKARRQLVAMNTVLTFINLGDGVFEDAQVPTAIINFKKVFEKNYQLEYLDLRKHEKNQQLFINTIPSSYSKQELLLSKSAVLSYNKTSFSLLEKITKTSSSIDYIAEEVANGIQPTGDKVFRISEGFSIQHKLEPDLLKPVLVGGDFHRYVLNDTKMKVIYTTKNVDINAYPNILKYLLAFKEQLSKKRETKKGTLPWWCLHWSRYKKLFEEEKIVIRQTADEIIAMYDKDGYYSMNNTIILKIKDEFKEAVNYKYLLSLLNSKFINYIYKEITQEEDRTFAEVKPVNVRKLPVKLIDIKLQKPFIELADKIMSEKKANSKADVSKSVSELDKAVYKLFDLTNEEIAMVEASFTKRN